MESRAREEGSREVGEGCTATRQMVAVQEEEELWGHNQGKYCRGSMVLGMRIRGQARTESLKSKCEHNFLCREFVNKGRMQKDTVRRTSSEDSRT